MSPTDAIAFACDCVLLALLGVALYTDLTRGKVYNWCTVPAILLGLLMRYVAGALETAQGNVLADALGRPLIDGLLGLALALGIFGFAYLFHMLGGGDVKLMCAVGALMGWRFFFNAAVFTACAGALIAVGVLIWRGRLVEGLKSSLLALFAPAKFRKRRSSLPAEAPELMTIPYTAAIVIGTVAAWVLNTAF